MGLGAGLELDVQVTVNLLDAAMKESGQDKFLIDGFPRNAKSRDAFEKEVRRPKNIFNPTTHQLTSS